MTAAARNDADDLRRLMGWWQIELEASRAAELEERSKRAWTERLHHGNALTGLTFARREQRRPSEVLLWFRRQDREALPAHRVRSGYPALLWPAETTSQDPQPPSESRRQRGTIVRVTPATSTRACRPSSVP